MCAPPHVGVSTRGKIAFMTTHENEPPDPDAEDSPDTDDDNLDDQGKPPSAPTTLDDLVDEQGRESFPASDPPAY
jgi:hypothetical protein